MEQQEPRQLVPQRVLEQQAWQQEPQELQELQQQVLGLPLQAPLQQVQRLLQQEQASCLLLRERYAACALREAQWLTMVP